MHETAEALKRCTLCPNNCRADRHSSHGFCLAGAETRVAYSGIHLWEEPVLSGGRGSGAIFFPGCTMRCVFCQNRKISREITGRPYTADELAGLISDLASRAENVNLVSPTPYVWDIMEAVGKARPEVPVVYNTGGYEKAETVRLLKDTVDVWLPDLKYVDGDVSEALSGKKDYFKYAFDAIEQMIRQTGKPAFSPDGMMKSGVIVRHLLIPSHIENTLKVIKVFAENFKDHALFSLMAQYVPFGVENMPEINRRITPLEYKRALRALDENGITDGFVQELCSADPGYVPDF